MSSNYLKAGTSARKEIRREGRTLIPARVVDIILDDTHPEFEDLGKWDSIGVIKYKLLGKSKSEDNPKSLPYAYPLRSHLKYIPLKNEIVLLTAGPSQQLDKSPKSAVTYYVDVVSIWNHPHYNPFPEDTSTEPEPGQDFVSKSDINPMQPFAGDVILEGRQGQSFRLSSTVSGKTPWTGGKASDPIIAISNGQIQTDNGYQFIKEDINKDTASIYLTSTQNIGLKLSQDLSLTTPASSTAGQVCITGGSLVLNSRTENTTITSAQQIGVKGTLVGIEATRGITLESGTIKLGAGAVQPVVLADSTFEFLNPVLDDLILLCNALTLTPLPQVQLTAQNLSLKIAAFKVSEKFMKSTKTRAQ